MDEPMNLIEEAARVGLSIARAKHSSDPFYIRHGRPKPPPIGDSDYDDYSEKHDGVLAVFKVGTRWAAWKVGLPADMFPTHAEAIAWAMKEVGW